MTLNPVTAYPFLILSDNRKQVKRGEKLQFFRNSQQRFDVWSCVMAKEGFSSGRHYWEVRPDQLWLQGQFWTGARARPAAELSCHLCRCLLATARTGRWAWSQKRPRGKACST